MNHDDFVRLVTEFGNACFDCGTWEFYLVPGQPDGDRMCRPHQQIQLKTEINGVGSEEIGAVADNVTGPPIGEQLYDVNAPAIEDVLARLASEVPQEEWNKLPEDLTDNLDHRLEQTEIPYDKLFASQQAAFVALIAAHDYGYVACQCGCPLHAGIKCQTWMCLCEHCVPVRYSVNDNTCENGLK